MTHLVGLGAADVLGAACPLIFLIAVLAIAYKSWLDRRRNR